MHHKLSEKFVVVIVVLMLFNDLWKIMDFFLHFFSMFTRKQRGEEKKRSKKSCSFCETPKRQLNGTLNKCTGRVEGRV